MTRTPPSASDPMYDQTRVSVLVEVPPDLAFQIFTEDIDRWWRRGLKYRIARGREGTLHLEPGIGGKLYESRQAGGDTALAETGRVTAWDPPRRLAFDWRAINFEPGDTTHVAWPPVEAAVPPAAACAPRPSPVQHWSPHEPAPRVEPRSTPRTIWHHRAGGATVL